MKQSTTEKKKSRSLGGRLKKSNESSSAQIQRDINCQAIENLISEGGSNFVRYLGMQDLLSDPDILLLSPRRHYFVDHTELLSTGTLIFMKKLNQVDNIESFLSDLRKPLSPGTNLVGCFSDSDRISKSRIISEIYKQVINFLDSRTENGFTGERVAKLLESSGFQVRDMTMIRGLVYIRAIAA